MPFTTVGSEILANTIPQGSTDQQITTLAGGRFVVTWTDYSQAGDDTDNGAVRARVYEATGTPVGSDFLVNTTTLGEQLDARVTALSSGGFVVTWEDASNGPTDIKAQVFTLDGTPVGSEVGVESIIGHSQYDPEITGLEGGRFVITWTASGGSDGSGAAIMARVFEGGGTPSGPEFQVNSATYLDQEYPKITALADGGFVAMWADGSQGQDVRAQVFAADGTPVGTEILVNASPDENQIEPQVTALSGGGFAIVWTEQTYNGFQMVNFYDLRAQVFEANGTPVGAQDILVNSTPRNSNYEPKIQGLANGGFVIAWEDETGDADNGSVQARVYGADGAPVGTAILVNTTTDGTQSDPRIAALADGGFVIAFTDGDAGADVRAQAFSEAGARVGTEILVNSTTAGDQGNAQVTALDEGGFVVTWRDAGDLRAQVFGIEGGAPQPSPEPPAPPPTEGTADEDEVTLSMKSDSYAAGSGNDWVWAGGGHDTVQGNTGNDVLHGYDGDDLMHGGKDDDEVLGEDGNDLLFGDLGNDLVHGGAGNDLCEGGEGNDIVRGGQGNDVVRGGAGDDWLSGDKGDDTVTGGTGADIFHSFSGAGLDRITDFSRAEGDRIQLDPGTTYTVAQTGADTVVTLGGGGQVVLVGVTASTLGEGWIFGA